MSSTEFEGFTKFKDFGFTEKGQMHFFNLVTDSGSLVPWSDAKKLEERHREIAERNLGLNVSLEELLEAYPLPKRLDLNGAIESFEAGFDYPVGKTILFKDPASELVVAEIFYEAREDLKPSMPVKERFKPKILTHFNYSFEEYDHPILKKRLPVVSVLTLSWDLDSRYRRINRISEDLEVFVGQPNGKFDPGLVRTAQGLVVSYSFEEIEHYVPVCEPLKMIENSRVYFFTNGHITYSTDPTGKIRLAGVSRFDGLQWGGNYMPSKEELPQELDEAPKKITI